MLDRISFAPEIGMIDSLSVSQTKGQGTSDQAAQAGSSFWNVLASEIHGAADSSRTSESPPTAETSARRKENGEWQGEGPSRPSDEKPNETQAGKASEKGSVQETQRPAEENGDVKGVSENSVDGFSTAKDAEPQPGTNPHQVLVSCQESLAHPPKGDIPDVMTHAADALPQEAGQEVLESQDKRSGVTAEFVGISQTGLPITVKVISGEEKNTDQVGETGSVFELEAKPSEKKPGKSGLQSQVVRNAVTTSEVPEGGNQTSGMVGQEQTTEKGETVSNQLRSAFPSVSASGGQSNVAAYGVSRKKDSAGPPGQDNGVSFTVTKKLTTGMTEIPPQNAGPVNSYVPSVSPGQVVSDEQDENVKPVEGAKQEGVDSVSARDDSAKTQVFKGPKAGEPSSAQNPLMRADQAQQMVTIQRVAQAIRLAHERNGEIRLRLHPPELGALRLQMRVQGGVLTARLEVETPAAREVLLDNIAGLRERLAEHQIRVEHFDVTLMNGSLGGQTSGREEFLGSPHPPRYRGVSSDAKPSEETGDQMTSIVTRHIGDRQFDVFI